MNENPVLIVSDGQLTGERWIVDREKLVIGRGNDCEVILPERQISRYHAEILHETGKFFLHDLDSKNGTHLNGNQVKGTVPLNDGDEIQKQGFFAAHRRVSRRSRQSLGDPLGPCGHTALRRTGRYSQPSRVEQSHANARDTGCDLEPLAVGV